MATLSDLAGKSCPQHSSPITVGKSGNVATCQAGCDTATLRAWAVSLNGHLENGNAPPGGASGASSKDGQSSQGKAQNNGKPEQDQDDAHDLLSWKAKVFGVAESLLLRDVELRALNGEPLFDGLLKALVRLVDQIPGYAPPEALTPIEIGEELENVARLAIGEQKAKQPNGPKIPDDEVLKPLDLGQLYDLCDEWDRQPWVWEGILPHSSLSLIVGKSETGKSTLIYGLLYAIVRGLDFFGRQCEQGRVLYLAGDPMSEIVAGKTFRELGLDRSDGVKVLPGALASNPSGLKQLRDIIKDYKPSIVVGDTLAATVEIDVDKYGQSQKAQHPLVKIAREFKPNFLMSHHSQKSAIDSYSVIDSALGTVGVAAVASTRMGTKLYHKGSERFYTFAMSNLRIGQPMEGEWIVRKLPNGLVELGGMWGSKAAELDRQAIIKALERQRGQWVSGRTLWAEVTPKPKYGPFINELRAMVDERRVLQEKGHSKGGGWQYKLNDEPPIQGEFGN